jgi:hypothetical protein
MYSNNQMPPKPSFIPTYHSEYNVKGEYSYGDLAVEHKAFK